MAAAENETSFTSVLKEAIGAVSETGKKSDIQTRAMANGKSNMVDVVTAVAETEVAIDARGCGARQGHRGLRRNHEDADLIFPRRGERKGIK